MQAELKTLQERLGRAEGAAADGKSSSTQLQDELASIKSDLACVHSDLAASQADASRLQAQLETEQAKSADQRASAKRALIAAEGHADDCVKEARDRVARLKREVEVVKKAAAQGASEKEKQLREEMDRKVSEAEKAAADRESSLQEQHEQAMAAAVEASKRELAEAKARLSEVCSQVEAMTRGMILALWHLRRQLHTCGASVCCTAVIWIHLHL